MIRMAWLWIVLLLGSVEGAAFENVIAVAYGQDANTTEAARSHLEHVLKNDAVMHKILQGTHARISVEHVGDASVLQLGPLVPDEHFAVMYLSLRRLFPKAVVIEHLTATPRAKPTVPAPGKKSVRTQDSLPISYRHAAIQIPREDASVDSAIWIALFGLAIIGILYMFLSSDQLRRIKREHSRIFKRQKNLEVKQHAVLAQMGENIHTLAQETAMRTQSLADQTQGESLKGDMQKVIDGENELLGVTSDLIKFLQIKAQKIIIQNAPFDFNNVLHEVAGTLHIQCQASDKELVFDLAKDVPRQMEADSLHMVQVLTNLIEYLMCHTPSHEVRLRANIRPGSAQVQILEVVLHADGGMLDEEKLFDAYYDETTKKYIGLGLFVARELLQLMGGELTLSGEKGTSTQLVLTFPVGEKSKDRRQYRLPDRAIMDKRTLVVDRNPFVNKALHQFLDYFKMSVTEMTAEDFLERMPDFSQFDIVVIDNTLFEDHLLRRLYEIRRKGSLSVISLENLYASETTTVDDLATIRMNKPLTQQHVFDVLIRLGHHEKDAQNQTTILQETPDAAQNIPDVFRGDFEDRSTVTLEDFGRFSGTHILIVEDNLVNQKVLKGMLSKAGLELSIANNGQEALDRLEELGERVDMILMDISMPVMDGFTATQKIHEDPRYQQIPIVTLTALVSDHEVGKMFALGANGYLAKPLKIGKLFSALEQFLPQRKSLNENEIPLVKTQSTSIGIDGLEIAEAISNMQNNTLLYQEVLREFKDFYGNSDAVFEKLIRDTRYEQLLTLCVDLRGLTGSIGARGLFDVVSEAQTMLVYRKYDLLERYIKTYRQELALLNEAIDTYLR